MFFIPLIKDIASRVTDNLRLPMVIDFLDSAEQNHIHPLWDLRTALRNYAQLLLHTHSFAIAKVLIIYEEDKVTAHVLLFPTTLSDANTWAEYMNASIRVRSHVQKHLAPFFEVALGAELRLHLIDDLDIHNYPEDTLTEGLCQLSHGLGNWSNVAGEYDFPKYVDTFSGARLSHLSNPVLPFDRLATYSGDFTHSNVTLNKIPILPFLTDEEMYGHFTISIQPIYTGCNVTEAEDVLVSVHTIYHKLDLTFFSNHVITRTKNTKDDTSYSPSYATPSAIRRPRLIQDVSVRDLKRKWPRETRRHHLDQLFESFDCMTNAANANLWYLPQTIDDTPKRAGSMLLQTVDHSMNLTL